MNCFVCVHLVSGTPPPSLAKELRRRLQLPFKILTKSIQFWQPTSVSAKKNWPECIRNGEVWQKVWRRQWAEIMWRTHAPFSTSASKRRSLIQSPAFSTIAAAKVFKQLLQFNEGKFSIHDPYVARFSPPPFRFNYQNQAATPVFHINIYLFFLFSCFFSL